MSSSSPAHSSVSTTAIVGGGGGGGSNSTLSADDSHFPCDPLSTYERKDEAILGFFCILSSPQKIQNLCLVLCVSSFYILICSDLSLNLEFYRFDEVRN